MRYRGACPWRGAEIAGKIAERCRELLPLYLMQRGLCVRIIVREPGDDLDAPRKIYIRLRHRNTGVG